MPNALTHRGAVILSAVCLACLMSGLEISSVPTILPTLEGVLHADVKWLQWVMSAHTIAATTVLMAGINFLIFNARSVWQAKVQCSD